MRPSDDPAWEQINPVWRVLEGDREYEILYDVEVNKDAELNKWFVFATVRSFEDHPRAYVTVSFTYDDPYAANDAKRNIENHAYRIHFEKDQVPVGRLPQ